MTPTELRVRAWKNIESARKLLDSDPDMSSHLAGLAVELTLKARYCTRNGWLDFPKTKKELQDRKGPNLFIHDLKELLALTKDEQIKTSSMHNVDWLRASNWHIEDRYTPVGTVTAEAVKAQIDEAEKLFFELVHYEIVEKLRDVEIEQSPLHGPFNFFSLVSDPDSGGWTVWMSTWRWCCGPRQEFEARFDAMVKCIKAALAPDLANYLHFRHLEPDDKALLGFYVIYQSLVGPVQHQMLSFTSHNAFWNIPTTKSAYVVTCINWDRESALKYHNGLSSNQTTGNVVNVNMRGCLILADIYSPLSGNACDIRVNAQHNGGLKSEMQLSLVSR